MNDNSIHGFVKDVLKTRFKGDRHRQEINDEDPRKLNFACPYCGDSENDPTKKRGNLYVETNSYKCFNDGCLIWVPLNKFISNFALKYGIPIPEIERKKSFKKVKVESRRGEIIEFLMNPKVKSSLLDFSYIQNRFFLIPCKDSPKGSPVREYVEARKLMDLPSFEQSCYYDSNNNKIFIFNLDLKSGKVLGFSMRRIDPDFTGPKYNIKNYSELLSTGILSGVDEEIVRKIDQINNYYNILNVNFREPVTVTEGQIDAMFVRNCISTTGVTKSKTVLKTLLTKRNSRILFDNDKAGKSESIKLIQEGFSVFLWSKLIDTLKRSYPSEIRKILGIKDINDLYRFLSDISETSFEDFNNYLDEYFSDSIYDMHLI
jgi:hypothetical protein